MSADATGSSFETEGSGSGSEDGGMGGVLAGVGIAVVASVGINIGNNMQALGMQRAVVIKASRIEGGHSGGALTHPLTALNRRPPLARNHRDPLPVSPLLLLLLLLLRRLPLR